MEFDLDKCIREIVKHVKLTTSQNVSLNSQTVIRNTQLDLGIAEGEGMDQQMKDTLVKEYYCHVWQILKMVKLKEQDHSCQHLSCAIPSLQFLYSQLVKKMN